MGVESAVAAENSARPKPIAQATQLRRSLLLAGVLPLSSLRFLVL